MTMLTERAKDWQRRSGYKGEVNPRFFTALWATDQDLLDCPVCEIPVRHLLRAMEAIQNPVPGMKEEDRLSRSIRLTLRLLNEKISYPEDD